MAGWKSRVDDLLYDGETARETVDVGTSRVVVTSHRVLAFTPDADGENFRQADRPNIEDVETGSATDDWSLRYALRFGIVGGIFAVLGAMIDFGDTFGDIEFNAEAAGQVGAGGLISVAQTLIDILAMLDVLLLVFGLLALLLAGVLVGVYLFQRDPTLVIRVAGDEENIHLPRSDAGDETRRRLEAAIFPDRGAGTAGSVGGDGTSDDGFDSDDDFGSTDNDGFGNTEDSGSGWN